MPNLNALSATTDINTVITWVNQAITNGSAPIAPEYFYSKQLLDTIRMDADQYKYFKIAETAPIQERADKLMLRRWSALQAHTTPLTEGVPPISDKGSVEKYELEAFQYGRYMEFTDKVSFKVVDPVIAHYTKEYSLVAMETMDLLARDALLLNAQTYYANAVAGFEALTFNSTPNMTDLRKIVLTMKKLLVKPRSKNNYLVIGSPEFFFDMFDDPTVVQYMTINKNSYNVFDGAAAPLPPMFGLEWDETLQVLASGEFVDAQGNKKLRVYTGTVDAPTFATLDDSKLSVAAGYVTDSRTGKPGSYDPAIETWTLSGGQKEFKAHHIFVIGQGALTRTGLSGEDNAKMYVKPLGSAGVLDPIDQRQSIGFKINSLGFGSTRPEAIFDYVCVPTQANV